MISVFDIGQLQGLLKSFYTVSQIRITVFDDHFNEITAYPPDIAGFCTCIRKKEAGRTACFVSDRTACQMVKRRIRPYIYECPSGLMEAIFPIQMNHIIIGYLLFGHLSPCEDPEEGWQHVSEKCRVYDIDMDELKEEYEKLRWFSGEYLESCAQIMETVANYLCAKRMAVLRHDTLAVRIDQYITEHLSEEISAEEICSHFHISRTRLYEISGEVYGVGIAAHIRNARIEKAQHLLTESDLPIREVAAECGIMDYNYFSKMFRRCTGYAPQTYRKLHALAAEDHP